MLVTSNLLAAVLSAAVALAAPAPFIPDRDSFDNASFSDVDVAAFLQKRDNLRYGSCNLGEKSNIFKYPDIPKNNALIRALKSSKAANAAKQAWWITNSPADGAPTLGYQQNLPDKSQDPSVDHAYEKSLVGSFFNFALTGASDSTCQQFIDMFVDTKDGNWLTGNPGQGDPNKPGQSRLKSLYNLLPNKLNVAVIGMPAGINQMKAPLFNDNLGSMQAIKEGTSEDVTRANLESWSNIGLVMDMLKEDIVQQTYQLVNVDITGAYHTFDSLWEACHPDEPLHLGDKYKEYMSTLLSTNLASMIATASAFSSSIEHKGVLTNADGSPNAYSTSFSRLAQSYAPGHMTYPTASYLNFPDNAESNIKRTAAAADACPRPGATTTASSGTKTASSGSVTAVKSSSGSSAKESINTSLGSVLLGLFPGGTHTPSSGSKTATSKGPSSPAPTSTGIKTMSSAGGSSSASATPSCNAATLQGSAGCKCVLGGRTDFLPPMTGSNTCGYKWWPAPPAGAEDLWKSYESATQPPKPTAVLTMGTEPVHVGVMTNLAAVSSSINSALRTACSPPATDGQATGCAKPTVVIQNIEYAGDEQSVNGLGKNGELVFDLVTSSYESAAMLDGMISSLVSGFMNSATGKNCQNVTYSTEEGREMVSEQIMECAATNFLSVGSFLPNAESISNAINAEVSFQLKKANDFACEFILDIVQEGLDALEPELAPLTAVAIGELGACCQGECSSSKDIFRSIVGAAVSIPTSIVIDNKAKTEPTSTALALSKI